MSFLSIVVDHVVPRVPQLASRLLPEGDPQQIFKIGYRRARMQTAQQQAGTETADSDYVGESVDTPPNEPDAGFWNGVVEWVQDQF